MKKRYVSMAAAALAIGLTVSATAPAQAAVAYLGPVNCLPSGYVGVYVWAGGTVTASATSGILSWGKTWNVPWWGESHSASWNTRTATSTQASTSTSGFTSKGSGCYTTVRVN